MFYTLTKFLVWAILAAIVGGVVGWALRALRCRGEIARALVTDVDHDEVERMRHRLANLEQVVAERDRLRMQVADMRHADSPGFVGARVPADVDVGIGDEDEVGIEDEDEVGDDAETGLAEDEPVAETGMAEDERAADGTDGPGSTDSDGPDQPTADAAVEPADALRPSDVDLEPATSDQATVEPDPDRDPSPDSDPDPDRDPSPDSDPDPDPDPDPDVSPDSESDRADPDPDRDGPTDSGSDPDRDAPIEADPRPELDPAEAASVIGKQVTLDDLTVVEGIGPKIAELCSGIGVTTWEQLADTDVAALQSMLDDAGSRFRVHDPADWPRQAELLASGNWEEFVRFTGHLGGG